MHIAEVPRKVLELKWAQNILIDVLKQGPLPKHVAFIMDGNRRYAKSHGLPIKEGHVLGATALENIIEMASSLGIKALTVYAFSIENFQRPQEQVDQLMQQFKSQLIMHSRPGGILEKWGIKIRVLGRLELLSDDLKEHIEREVKKSATRNGAVLNLCIPYTSRDEIARSIRKTVQEHGGPTAGITSQTLANNMDICDDPPVDILVRTSGVNRLSDFLLWQCNQSTDIQILDIQWPEFGYWGVFLMILGWQKRRPAPVKYQATKKPGGRIHTSHIYFTLLLSIIVLIVPITWG
ncbi:uncharacterized protein GIQ15_00035 [Arthroderma uncinatum]|uniref:uncharacterized protein n=1 Tax=Arthroderma uncinatum TaxID=74035 RepID=UPI00144AB3BB|nr:uncharacterized protein GIQ15_00035 [Arthroderma uncinatum]KAF3490518.1 hypothetical protein GIQ15_00035 [Arthroderma uncinatum]